MKDEIKEILDDTLEYLEGIDETRNIKILTTNETNILLDYITNLQEENARLKQTQYIWSYDLDMQLEDYKSRIEKAINLTKRTKILNSWYELYKKDLLNILNGND